MRLPCASATNASWGAARRPLRAGSGHPRAGSRSRVATLRRRKNSSLYSLNSVSGVGSRRLQKLSHAARRSAAAVIRSAPAGEFSLSIQPLEHARLGGDKIESAQYMNDQIEQLARRFLEQYQWSYRRFSNRVYESV